MDLAPLTACAHTNAVLVGRRTIDFVSARCPDCEEIWRGPCYDWTSKLGSRHLLPDWVRRLVLKAPKPPDVSLD